METIGAGPKDVSKKIQDEREVAVAKAQHDYEMSIAASNVLIREMNAEAAKYPASKQRDMFENGSSADVLELRGFLIKALQTDKELLRFFGQQAQLLKVMFDAVMLREGPNQTARLEYVESNLRQTKERTAEVKESMNEKQLVINETLKQMAEKKRKETKDEEEKKRVEEEAEAERAREERKYKDMPKLMTGTPEEEKEALESDRLVGKGKRPREGPSSDLQKAMDYALSGQDMLDALGKIPLVKYNEIDKFETPEALFQGSKIAVVLFLTISEQMGHWLGLINHTSHYEVFDSFGVSTFCGVFLSVFMVYISRDLEGHRFEV